MNAIAAMGLKANVVGALVLAENAIDANSGYPHEIMKSYKAPSSPCCLPQDPARPSLLPASPTGST